MLNIWFISLTLFEHSVIIKGQIHVLIKKKLHICFFTKSLKTNLICSFLKWLINALSFFTRLHICVYQIAYFNSGTYGQCNHHIFPVNETEKRKQ